MDTYPKEVELSNCKATLSLMSRQDGSDMQAFASSLPAHDLMFLRRDIVKPEIIESWVNKIEAGNNISVIAKIDGGIIGYGTLSLGDIDWSRHVSELRIMVAPDSRESGIGRTLVRELFRLAVERGVEKIYARMTVDQTGARKLFQELGFRPEALLIDEVKDRAGELHDVLSMAVDVDAFLARRDTYGLNT